MAFSTRHNALPNGHVSHLVEPTVINLFFFSFFKLIIYPMIYSYSTKSNNRNYIQLFYISNKAHFILGEPISIKWNKGNEPHKLWAMWGFKKPYELLNLKIL